MDILKSSIAYTPLRECNSPCAIAEEECTTPVEYTVAFWVETEHGPLDEPVVWHTCRTHAIDVILSGTHAALKAYAREIGQEIPDDQGG